ncbi:hypothetical protein [Lysinibacillus xylanilyticus]|uniref:hypothetical protein n=1 Tax=Lysinibacillus xylanilyticus TaxID=582475 RepID=UPI003D0890E6
MNPLSLNGYNYANNNPVMNVDPDGTAAVKYYVTKIAYTLATALIYLAREFFKGIIVSVVIGIIYNSVMNYTATKNAKKVGSVGEAMRISIKNPNYMNQIKKQALSTAVRFGIKSVLKLNTYVMAFILSTGFYRGWNSYNKYKNLNPFSFGNMVYNKYGMPGWW